MASPAEAWTETNGRRLPDGCGSLVNDVHFKQYDKSGLRADNPGRSCDSAIYRENARVYVVFEPEGAVA